VNGSEDSYRLKKNSCTSFLFTASKMKNYTFFLKPGRYPEMLPVGVSAAFGTDNQLYPKRKQYIFNNPASSD
jgi:hypothetical protein